MKAPEHIGIIPDGNRRCARRLLRQPWKGHEWGVSKVKKIFDWAKNLGVKSITFYALSLENMEKRPKREINYLFRLARKEVRDIIINRSNFVHKNRIKIIFFGNLERIPEDLQSDMKKAMEITRNYKNYTINFAIAYGGRQEIVDACRKIALDINSGRLKPEDVNEAVIRHNLQTNGSGDPDLIIRTGGEERLSNFLLFQSAYSELVFLKTLWPELKKEEFINAIKAYSERERRFGR